jgi:type III secretory pathway component EscV
MSMNGLKVPSRIVIGDLIAGLVMVLVSIPGGLAQEGLLSGAILKLEPRSKRS